MRCSMQGGGGHVHYVFCCCSCCCLLLLVMVTHTLGLSRDAAFVGYSERYLGRQSSSLENHGLPLQQKEHLVFETKYGEITVELQKDYAPQTVRYVKSLASRGLFDGCGIYRAEPPGETNDDGHPGTRKGYALLQGGLFSCGRQENKELPLEPKLNNSKGAVSLITGTSEFFFSLEDHPEWNGSFSVWGKVVGARSWRVLERLVALPTRQEIHPSGTTLRILLKPVVFKARIGTNVQPTLIMD
ncbi:unnamed protein product [Sphagnum compactum]